MCNGRPAPGRPSPQAGSEWRGLCARPVPRLQALAQEAQETWRGQGTEPTRLVLERIGRPEMAGAWQNDAARPDAGLVEREPERVRLRGRIDDIVVGTVDQQEARPLLVHGRVAHRRGFEIDAPVLHR